MLQFSLPFCAVLKPEGLIATGNINIAATSPAFVPADDHSRVELSLITSDIDSHYINANFIKVLLLSWCSTV